MVLDPSKIFLDAASAQKDRRTLLRGVAGLTLPYIPRPQSPTQIAQQATLVGGPGGGHELAWGGAALKAVDDYVRWNTRQGGAEHVHIFVAPERVIETCGIESGEGSTLGHKYVVQLEPLDGQGKRPVEALQKMALVFAGQTGHQVGAHGYAALGGHAHGFFCMGGGVPAIYAAQGRVMGRLQAKLQPQVAIQRRQCIEFGSIKAIGAGSHGHAKALRQAAHGMEQLLQAFLWPIGVREGLQIGNKARIGVVPQVHGTQGIPLL